MAFSDDAPVGLLKKQKANKYKNEKTVVGGIKFDSRKEADRWIILRALEACGGIRNLKRQVHIGLIVKGVHICKWIADFVYERDGKTIYEDVKSKHTRKLPVYRLKKKLVNACMGIEILET